MKKLLVCIGVLSLGLVLVTSARADWRRTVATMDTETTGAQVFEAELGFDHFQWPEDTGNSSEVYGIGRYGILENWDAYVSVDYLWDNPDGGENESGFGDVFIGTKYMLLNEIDQPVDLSLAATVKLPTADEDKGLGTGKADVTLRAAVAKTFGQILGVAGVGYTFVGEPDNVDWDNQILWGVEAAYLVNDEFHLNLGFTGRTARSSNSDDLAWVTVGGRYIFLESWQVGTGVSFGLTDDAADWGIDVWLGKRF
ncbi:MAG: transporter [Candidatus Theseobacter exili]|nr:transporter [Candidatus Theseobacter exili]